MLANRSRGRLHSLYVWKFKIFLDKISTGSSFSHDIFFRRGERIAVITCVWNIINLASRGRINSHFDRPYWLGGYSLRN